MCHLKNCRRIVLLHIVSLSYTVDSLDCTIVSYLNTYDQAQPVWSLINTLQYASNCSHCCPWVKANNLLFNNSEQLFRTSLTSFPVDITATTGNLWTSTSVTPTVARRPISDGPMWVPFASTHSPRLMSWPIGLCKEDTENDLEKGMEIKKNKQLNTTKNHTTTAQQSSNLMSCPGRACTRIRTSSSSVPWRNKQTNKHVFHTASVLLRARVPLTSSDSRSSSVSSTWTTASAPHGMGAPVVTLITWPGITVCVGCTDKEVPLGPPGELLQVCLWTTWTTPACSVFRLSRAFLWWAATPKAKNWRTLCVLCGRLFVSQKQRLSLNINMGSDLLSSLWLSYDEAVARAVSRYGKRRVGGKKTQNNN